MAIVTRLGDFSHASKDKAFRRGSQMLETAAIARELVKHATNPESVSALENARDRGILGTSVGGRDITVARIFEWARHIYLSVENSGPTAGNMTFDAAVERAMAGLGAPIATPNLDRLIANGGYVDSQLYQIIHTEELMPTFDDPEYIAALTARCTDTGDMIMAIPHALEEITQRAKPPAGAAMDTL